MQHAHHQLHNAGQETEEHRVVCIPVLDLLVRHERHQSSRAQGYVFAGPEYYVDEAAHKRRV